MILDKIKKKVPSENQEAPINAIVALDIGTEFVKALVAEIDGDQINVVGVGRKRQNPNDMHAGAISDIGSVVQNCERALADAEEEAGYQVKNAVMGIAGELVKGVTHTIRYRRPHPNKVLDEEEMDFIINKVQDRALEKAQKQIAIETGNDEVEVKLVNSALVGIHIDGYKVTNPIGFQGRDVAIQIYTACAPMVHIGALESVADELQLELVAVSAEPFAVARSVIGTDIGSHFTSILADVGGGTTDIAVVNDGGVEGTKMYGIGGRSFTKSLSNQLNLTYAKSENLKISLENQEINPELRQKSSEIIDKTLDVWLDGFELSLNQFKDIDQLPNQILLCGGGAGLKGLVEKISKHKWSDDLPFIRQPIIKHISLKNVVGITDKTKKIGENDYTFITAFGLLRVGCDTVQIEDNNNLKQKLNKFLRI